MDVHTLGAVHLLDLVHEVALTGADALYLEHALRIERALGDLGTRLDDVAFGDPQAGTNGEVLTEHLFVTIDDDDRTPTGVRILVERHRTAGG